MILSAAGAGMQNKANDMPDARPGGTEEPDSTNQTTQQPGTIARSVQSLLQMGVGELLVRAATNIFSVVAIVIVIWLAQAYFRQPVTRAQVAGAQAGPTSLPVEPPSDASVPVDLSAVGISRQA